MSARDLVEQWVITFNAGDASRLADFYHEDAINHQVAEQPVTGRAAIREMFAREFASADMVCLVELGYFGMEGPAGPARLRIFSSNRGENRFAKGLLGQTQFSAHA